jgi:translation initiation factor 1
MKNKREPGSRQSEYTLVYSTSGGRICPVCSNPADNCSCHKKTASPKGDGIIRVSRSVKGRKGKGVTLITGIPLAGDDLKDLALKLKQRCGAGGTIKDGTIEIQGDHRDRLVAELTKLGYSVKRSGG